MSQEDMDGFLRIEMLTRKLNILGCGYVEHMHQKQKPALTEPQIRMYVVVG